MDSVRTWISDREVEAMVAEEMAKAEEQEKKEAKQRKK
jgi:hypothetical protein